MGWDRKLPFCNMSNKSWFNYSCLHHPVQDWRHYWRPGPSPMAMGKLFANVFFGEQMHRRGTTPVRWHAQIVGCEDISHLDAISQLDLVFMWKKSLKSAQWVERSSECQDRKAIGLTVGTSMPMLDASNSHPRECGGTATGVHNVVCFQRRLMTEWFPHHFQRW